MKIGDIIKNKSDNMIGLIIDFKSWHWPKNAVHSHKSGRKKPIKKVIVMSELEIKEWILDHTEVVK